MTPTATLRAGRFEVVDAAGQVRAVFGHLGAGPDSGDTYGVSLLDSQGQERAALTLDQHGPTLVFLHGGNIAVQVGVGDPALPGDHSGAFITIADNQGSPLVQLWLDAAGSLRVEAAQ